MAPTPLNPQVPARVLPILVISQFGGTALWFAPNAVIPELEVQYGWPSGASATMASLLQVGFIVGTLLFAIWAIADRFRPRWVFFGACSLGATLTWVSGFLLDTPTALGACRFASGVALAGIYPVGMKIASQWYRGRMGSALGWLIGALILGSAAPHGLRAATAWGLGWDWTSLFPAIAGLVALAGCLQAVALPDAPPLSAANPALSPPSVEPAASSASGSRGGAASPTAHAFDWAALGALWTDSKVRASVFAYFGHMWELYTVWLAVPLILATRLDADWVALLAFLILGSGSISCMVGGRLSLRWGSARVGGAFLGVSGLCCLLSPWMMNSAAPWFYAWLVMWGLSVSSDSPQFSALTASNAPPQAVGSVLTLTNSLGFALSVASIQVFSALAPLIALPWLLCSLAVGPLLGLWMLRRLW